MIHLPPTVAVLEIPWWDEAQRSWDDVTRRARDMRRQARVGVPPSPVVDAVRAALHSDDDDRALSLARSRAHARAMLWVWGEADGDCRDTVTTALVEAVVTTHARPTALVLRSVEALYLDRYDELDDLTGDTKARMLLGGLLRDAHALPPRTDEMTAVLTSADAADAVAHLMVASGQSMPDEFRRWGLTGHDGGRFTILLHQFVLLSRLESIPWGDDDEVLDEVLDERVYNAPHLRGCRLGHAALNILIDRGEGYPGDRWRDVVLTVAGDPRIAHGDHYETWWSVLGRERAEKVMSWLARADLSVFLQALEHFSESDGRADMERMFPARKQFLEGLINLGRVRRSRLYLGQSVRNFVERATPPERRWYWADLTGGLMRDRALIYVDCGDFHLIEGSHNTQMWVYLEQPAPTIVDPARRQFAYRDLTSGLAETYRDTTSLIGALPDWSQRHNGLWQHGVLDFLARNGIRVDPETVLSASDYRTMRHRFGIPLVAPHKAARAAVHPDPQASPGLTRSWPPSEEGRDGAA